MVVKHEVDYRVPLVYREEPVSIETWVTKVGAASFTMAYEIFDESANGERTVYVQARSQLAPYVFSTESPRRITETERDVLAQLSDDHEGPRARKGRLARDSGDAWRHRYDCHVRFSDVDIYRHVNNVKYFEYVQEARISMVGDLVAGGIRDWSLVVGAIDVEYSRPIVLRARALPDRLVGRERRPLVVRRRLGDLRRRERALARPRRDGHVRPGDRALGPAQRGGARGAHRTALTVRWPMRPGRSSA